MTPGIEATMTLIDRTAVMLAVAIAVCAMHVSSSAATPDERIAGDATCRIDTSRASACALVNRFFGSIREGRYERACSLLGAQLRAETGGPRCPSIVALARTGNPRVVGARSLDQGVGVRVVTFLNELGHLRRLSWLAVVADEEGSLRILRTRRLA